MGTVSLEHSSYTDNWPLSITVYTSNPVLACLGSQYAGWSLAHEKYFALGSGPARAMATKEKEGQLPFLMKIKPWKYPVSSGIS